MRRELTVTLLIFVAAVSFSSPVLAQTIVDRSANNRRVIDAAARLYGFDPELLEAIAKIESNGDSAAISPAGARGLMQLMPATASRFGVIDIFDPVDNTLGAARFLSWLRESSLGRYDDSAPSLPELLAAYNAGEAAVVRYRGIPPYPETRSYVRKVLLAYLFSDARSALTRRTFFPGPGTGRVTLPRASDHDNALDKLITIQQLRAVALRRDARVQAALPAAR